MLCSKCKKRMAMIFVTRMEDGKPISEGLCLPCAREMKIPQLDDAMKQMGINEEELEAMEEQMNEMMDADGDGFEPGGLDNMPGFMQNLMGNMKNMFGKNDEEESDALTLSGDDDGFEEVPAKVNGSTGYKRQPGEPRKNRKKRKFLSAYCTDLTGRARAGELDNIIGRDREIYRMIQILSRRTKNNPCLIGEPGVGKTAVAEGIAQRIAAGDVPFRLQNKELFLLDMTALVAGTQFRGQFESRVKGLIDEVKADGNIILFIDEIHTIVGTGDSEGSMSAANIMKPALSRGEIQVIGATTFNEYRKYIEKDSALERRFQPVNINEPNLEETMEVLRGIKKYYEAYHKVQISDYIVSLVARLSERYITDRFLPDKAIDLMDEACSCRSIRCKELTEQQKLTKRLKELEEQEQMLEAQTDAIDYEKLMTTKSELMACRDQLKALEANIGEIKVEVSDVAKVIELWTGIPAAKIEENEYQKLAQLEDHLRQHIIGQDEAIHAVANAIKRSRVSLSVKKRPASFIFVGPTGVGKTELVKVLSQELFDSVDPLIRLDMTEYMEKHTVSKLIGSPPGYVGYDEAGQLTEKVRRRPYSVILFDEIEKAHPDVMNILLQILDEGRLSDSQGRTVNFENTVIVMTSNAGSSDQSGIVGFNKTAEQQSSEKALRALQQFLRPEFLGRVDEVVVFSPLSEETLAKIAGIMLDELKEPLQEKGIRFAYDEAAQKKLVTLAEGTRYAARDLRKAIRRHVEDPIAQLLIDRYEQPPTMLGLTVREDQLVLDTVD